MPDSSPTGGRDEPAAQAPPPSDPAPALLLSGARLPDGRTVDVRTCGPRIEAVGTAGSLTGGEPVDLRGYLLLPAPAEPHAHLEGADTAGLPGAPSEAPDDALRRTVEAALEGLGHGATAIRAQVRADPLHGLHGVEVAIRARALLHGLADVQVTAVPGVLTGPAAGADGRALLRDALRMGADAVGGCPDRDPDPTGHAEAVLRLADDFGVCADLHTDGADPAQLGRLAALAGGLRGRVTAGPAAALGALPAEAAARAADQLATCGVRMVCLPQGGCALSGHGPAPVRTLRAAGAGPAAGSGALRDTANPAGRCDPLHTAYQLVATGRLDPEEAYTAVSSAARAALGLAEVRVEAGFPAELLAVRGSGVAEALAGAYSRVVVHRGRIVSRTSAVREFTDAATLSLPRQAPRPGPAGRGGGASGPEGG